MPYKFSTDQGNNKSTDKLIGLYVGKPSQSTIEINGKRYDARTGQLIAATRTKTSPKPAAARPRRTAVMQDIARSAPTSSRSIHKQTQRSNTLMRHAVKKPIPAPRSRPAKARANSTTVPRSVKPIPSTKLILHHDVQRQARAKKVPQSALVSKFGSSVPAKSAAQPHIISSPIVQSRIAPATAKSTSAVSKLPVAPTQSVLEKGLRNATSHKQTYKPKKKLATRRKKSTRTKKLATYGAGALAAILLIGFIAYQNIPNISMRYAATRAGVSASLPGYQPAGFALNSRIQYNPGQITLNFDSNSDDRSFSITQRETAWNSDALLSNYVSSKPGQVQKYEDKGRTIFLYGDNSATWVSGGVWYDIDGNSQLNSDQLIRIATSL